MSNPSPLRILHLTAASEAGGLSRYLLDLSQRMHELGHTILIAGARGSWHERFAALPAQWIDLPMHGGPLALRRAARRLHERLGGQGVDVIHTHYRRPTLTARALQKHRPAPILYTLHLSHIPLRGPQRWFTDFGDHTHAPSQGARQWLLETANIPSQRITVIPHGIDVGQYPLRDPAAKIAARQALNIPPDAMVAAFVGRLDYPKNADWMLDVADSAPRATILLVGAGPDEPRLRRLLSRRKLAERVLLLGERGALPIYQASDALLLPSLREGFGLVCAEAMCVGVPVLRTRTSGTEELILEGVTGRSVEIDRAAFMSAAAEFLADRSALEKMGFAAAEHVRRHFTLDRQVAETIALYRRLQETIST